MSGYPVPARATQKEIRRKKSRFIAVLDRASDVDEAEDVVQRVKELYPDATHHVPAYIIGHGASKITHTHDDGEPSGTAGRPALSVLEGSGLGDAVLVITRYFGGTKLGTGGLVRAYSDAARAVTNSVPRAYHVQAHILQLCIPYPLYETLERIIQKNRGQIMEETFTDIVRLKLKIPAASYQDFREQCLNTSSGSIKPKILKKNVSATITSTHDSR